MKQSKSTNIKYWSKLFLVWILVALIIALFAGLCVEFWFPATERLYIDGKNTAELVVHGGSKNKGQLHYTAIEKQVELTTIAKEETNPPWHLDFLINPTRLCETWDSPETESYQRNPEVMVDSGSFGPRTLHAKEHNQEDLGICGSALFFRPKALRPHGPVRLGFVLGITSNATQQSLIRHESEAFGDIIQADFVDTFRQPYH
ncbi:hypothetical protein JTE90_019214 [Oedothorax gibbosus]|uniref:Uncharacterized protein n=1 Tax=Oedothorax gibbosus TaxID=931172 RepID=A0AAV6UCA8_9ARAC|nr:hypothetical protein JTE90_019214 [Oedothorax gibbosus]